MLTRTLTTLAVTITLTSIASSAQAQTKPFRVSGGGTVDALPLEGPETHWATGQATELGEYYALGVVQIDEFTSATTADFSSAQPCVFTAANGDELVFDYVGQVTLTPVAGGKFTSKWVATFTPVLAQCTGRFSKLTGGSFVMTALAGPFFLTDTNIPYTWSGEGDLTFGK